MAFTQKKKKMFDAFIRNSTTFDLDKHKKYTIKEPSYLDLNILKTPHTMYSFSVSNCCARCDPTTLDIQPNRPMRDLEKDKLYYQGHLLDIAQTSRSNVIKAPN